MEAERQEVPQFKHLAVIFDRDGTLVDTESALTRARATTVDEFLGVKISPEDNEATKGKGADGIFKHFLRQYGGDPQLLEAMMNKFRQEYKRIYAEEGVEPMSGGIDLIKQLKTDGLRLALGTGASMPQATHYLEVAGYDPKDFEIIVTGDTVRSQKPSPETFLAAGGRLGLAPFQCVVVGDAAGDIVAARFAGMPTIHINPEGVDSWGPNFATVTSLEHINNERIQTL